MRDSKHSELPDELRSDGLEWPLESHSSEGPTPDRFPWVPFVVLVVSIVAAILTALVGPH